jgi:hypothetical protein
VPLGLDIGNGPKDEDHWLVIIDNMVCPFTGSLHRQTGSSSAGPTKETIS